MIKNRKSSKHKHAEAQKPRLSASEQLDTYCKALSATGNVARRAMKMVRDVDDSGHVENGSTRAIISLCVLLASRREDKSLVYGELISKMRAPRAEMREVHRPVLKALYPTWFAQEYFDYPSQTLPSENEAENLF